MALDDFRQLVDVGRDAYVAVTIEHARAERPIILDVNLEQQGVVLLLDYYEAGLLYDTLAQALGIVIAAHGNPHAAAAVAGLELAKRDTPPAP